MITLALALLAILTELPREWYAFGVAAPLIIAHTGIAEPFGRGGPFWWYHWERFRIVLLPYLLGLALFGGLTALLLGLAAWGFLYDSERGRGALIGVWIADACLSHVLLRALFPGPNPGLRTSLLYLVAAAAGLCLFTVDPVWVVIGAAPFVLFHAASFALWAVRDSIRLRNARHNLIAHPVAGVCWLLGFERWGDWVHNHV